MALLQAPVRLTTSGMPSRVPWRSHTATQAALHSFRLEIDAERRVSARLRASWTKPPGRVCKRRGSGPWFTLLALVLCLHVPAPVDVSVPEWASFDFPGPSASPSSPSGILKQAAITCDHGDSAVLVMLHSDLRCCLVVLVGPFRSAGGRASEEPAGDMFADFPAPMPAPVATDVLCLGCARLVTACPAHPTICSLHALF